MKINKKNEALMGAVEKAVEDLFSDTTVSKEVCIENLETVIEDCQFKIDSLGVE